MTIRILNFPDGFSSSSQPGDILGYYKTYLLQILESGDTVDSELTFGFQRRPVIGDGAVTVSSTPFGNTGGWFDGTIITLIGSSATDTVTINYSDVDYGCLINGNITLGDAHSITLQWDEVRVRWFEIGRNI